MKKLLIVFSVIAANFILNHPAFGVNAHKKTPVREANINGRYSMMLPEYLTEDSVLNNEASLQYSNIHKEVYIIVIDESKQDFIDVYTELNEYDSTQSALENYAREQMESIRGAMSKITYESKHRLLKTGCGKAITYDVSAFQETIEDEMGFKVAFIEGRLNLYMIMTWTFQSSIKLYQDDMDAMVKSFKELSGELQTSPRNITYGPIFMKVPQHVYEDSLVPGAVLHYMSLDSTLNCTIFTLPSSKFDSAYSANASSGKTMLQFVSELHFGECSSKLIDVHDASSIQGASNNTTISKKFSLMGKDSVRGDEMIYKVRVVSANNTFYFVQCWTPASHRDQNEKNMDIMLNSFNILQ